MGGGGNQMGKRFGKGPGVRTCAAAWIVTDVGAVGYTLGGGAGWLARKYGLSCDSVNRFEVVTVDGRMRQVSASENTDLFWGLRGGGGSLAIVTGMEIRLYPVTSVYGGNLIYPVERAREVLQRYRTWIETLPQEMTSSVVLINYPPLPEVPDPLRGRSFAQVRGCFAGPVEQGEALMRFWRSWQPPLVDDFRITPFSQVAAISADPIDPMPVMSTGAFLRVLDDKTIDTAIAYSVSSRGAVQLIFTEIRHFGGRIAAVDPETGAYGNRPARLSLQTVGVTPGPEAFNALVEHTDRMKHALRQALSGGVYLNFLEGRESLDRTRDAYTPDNYDRLCAIKAAYDPENRLCYSLKILPQAMCI